MAIVEVKADTPKHLQDIADILAAAKKVVVFAGAGISTNCGIPDFRSKSGLYSLIGSDYQAKASASSSSKAPRNVSGRDLFDSSLWKDKLSTSVFYTFMASLRRKIREEVKETSTTHQFIRQLRDQKKLVRCYTQNIDGLEGRESLCTDLSRGKGSKSRFTKKAMQLPNSSTEYLPGGVMDGGCEVVRLHGDLDILRCTICKTRCGWEEHNSEAVFAAGEAPRCEDCAAQDEDRKHRGKRSIAVGSLRPNVVLYGEEHPAADTLSALTTHDLRFGPDVLLILGTSLKVHGLKVLVREHAKAVHRKIGKKGKVIFVNLTPPPGSVWKNVIDYWVAMDCDEWVHKTRKVRPSLFQAQTELALGVAKNRDGKPVSRTKGITPAREDENKENMSDVHFPGPDRSEDIKNRAGPLLGPRFGPNEAAPMPESKSESDLPRTPAKPKQLRTPPTSRPEPRSKGRPRKALISTEKELTALASQKQPLTPASRRQNRSYQAPVFEEEDVILVTPSKRRKKDICIWEDDQVNANHGYGKTLGEDDYTIGVVVVEGSQQGHKGTHVAASVSTLQARVPATDVSAEEVATPRKKRKRV
ncbi:hypothetical protein MMC30_002977 [Trapelia coarctata]|nr:hypothetical protein [Trapelia coarctata]